MEKETFNEYMIKRYKAQMEFYKNTYKINHKKYKSFQWILIILSALTPVLAATSGLAWTHENKSYIIAGNYVQLLVVIVSSIVAILSSASRAFKYQESAISSRTIYNQLKSEFYYYEFNAGSYSKLGIDKESVFVEQVESILKKDPEIV